MPERAVSRVLSWTIIHLGQLSPTASSNLPGNPLGTGGGRSIATPLLGPLRFARTPLFGLAPGGVYRAANCYQSRGALLPHHFTLTGRGRRYIFCGTFHGLTPPRRYLAPCPKEPGLSSVTQRVTAIAWPTPAFPGEDSTGKSRRRSVACAATTYERAPARDAHSHRSRAGARSYGYFLVSSSMRA